MLLLTRWDSVERLAATGADDDEAKDAELSCVYS